jgi:hypothetical protein
MMPSGYLNSKPAASIRDIRKLLSNQIFLAAAARFSSKQRFLFFSD